MKASIITLRTFTSWLLLAASLCCAGSVQAQNDAYTVEVAVAERSAQEEQDAYRAGLRRVLLNNSGDKTILNRDSVRESLERAETYVQNFSYRQPPAGTVLASDTPITRQVQRSGQATQLMLVSFNRELVNQLIAGSEPAATVEPEEDAATARQPAGNSALVWLMIQDDGREILITDPSAENVRSRAQEIAGAAGIALVYPTGDEEDQGLISNEDIARLDINVENLGIVGQKYAQDTILIGHIERQGAFGWQGRWLRVTGTQQQSADFSTSTLDEALQQGLRVLSPRGQVDERYRYGGSATSDTEALVWIGSIDSTEDYATVMQFFDSIDSIGTVYPKEVLATSMVFSVIPRNALTDIQNQSLNTPWLQRSAPPANPDTGSLVRNADLSLRFNQ